MITSTTYSFKALFESNACLEVEIMIRICILTIENNSEQTFSLKERSNTANRITPKFNNYSCLSGFPIATRINTYINHSPFNSSNASHSSWSLRSIIAKTRTRRRVSNFVTSKINSLKTVWLINGFSQNNKQCRVVNNQWEDGGWGVRGITWSRINERTRERGLRGITWSEINERTGDRGDTSSYVNKLL